MKLKEKLIRRKSTSSLTNAIKSKERKRKETEVHKNILRTEHDALNSTREFQGCSVRGRNSQRSDKIDRVGK
jgi:hypothetical protein